MDKPIMEMLLSGLAGALIAQVLTIAWGEIKRRREYRALLNGIVEVSIKIGFTNATTNGLQPEVMQEQRSEMTMQSGDIWATKNDDTSSLYRKWQNDSKTATCDCSQTMTSAGMH